MPPPGGQALEQPLESPTLLSVPWFSVLLLGAAALAYEILLIRLFSILHWHHFAHMAIGLALLGHGASGAFIAIFQKKLLAKFPLAFTSNIIGFAIAAPCCYYLSQLIPFNTQEIIWGYEQWWSLLLIELLLMLPFFFAASGIALTICYFKSNISNVYSADLVGSGFGAFAIVGLLYLLPLEQVLLVISSIALLAATIAHWQWKKPTSCLLTITLLLAGGLTFNFWPDLKVSEYKGLAKTLLLPETHTIRQSHSPLGRIDVVSSKVIPLRTATGISLNYQGKIPEQLGLFIDGESIGGITHFNGDLESIGYLDATTTAIGFHLLESHPRILITEIQDGTGILQSALHDPIIVDVIGSNHQLNDLFSTDLAEYFGWHHLSSFTHIHHSELRSWLKNRDTQYDLIQVNATEGMHANLLTLKAKYQLTSEAFEYYWRALSKQGVLSVTVWQDLPPKAALRIINTMLSVLENSAITHPGNHIVAIRNWQTVTLLLRKQPFDEPLINKVRQFNTLNHFDAIYYPGISSAETNQYNQLQQTFYYSSVKALIDDAQATDQFRHGFTENYPLDIAAINDDAPYFFHFYRFALNSCSLGGECARESIASLRQSGGKAWIPQGYLMLWLSLSQALLISILLIILPLLWLRKSSAGSFQPRHGALFFITVGLAFLMVEWAMIERFTLFLRQPAITGASVIGVFLVFASMGSAYSQNKNYSHISNITTVAILICFLCLLYHFLLAILFDLFANYGLIARMTISIFILAPLAFLMGMPFPMGLSKLVDNRGEHYLPWAWGINGCASVVGIGVAAIISVDFGFSATLLCAAMLYLAAAFLSTKQSLKL
ncbi:MAG: hypothetical protein COA99_02825 [Moraxellaceae bacterium]|nr:MAG: hypothetical protein COA99_02825 [Moraxellaceae bacterium]